MTRSLHHRAAKKVTHKAAKPHKTKTHKTPKPKKPKAAHKAKTVKVSTKTTTSAPAETIHRSFHNLTRKTLHRHTGGHL